MNCVAIDYPQPSEPGICCIVGFGNRCRRDDGVGPWIVEQLDRRPVRMDSVRLVSKHHLSPDLVEVLGGADRIILIDASVQMIDGGWHWEMVQPCEDLPLSLHLFNPGFMVYLLERVYGDRPEAWLISIQGELFGHGEGLSALTQKRAGEVMATLDAFLSKEGNYGHGA